MFTITGNNTIVNTTEVQRDFPRVIAKTAKQNVIVIRNNEPVAAIISMDKLQLLERQTPTPPSTISPPSVQYFIELVQKSAPKLKKNILSILLFGSYARGEATEKSDIDLLVMTKTSSKQWETIFSEWNEEAMAKTDYNDFLVVAHFTQEHWNQLKKAKALFVREVEREGIVLWKSS